VSIFVIPDIYLLLVTTFSRQYEVLLRGSDNRDDWVRSIHLNFIVLLNLIGILSIMSVSVVVVAGI
jgi:hypothetical protein